LNLLESLKRCTNVVADTGDIEAMAVHKPQDATTNMSLLYQVAQKPQFGHLVGEALRCVALSGSRVARNEAFMDALLIAVGYETLKVVPGRVSTEVDARLSFDSDATLAKARKLIAAYAEKGVGRDRILIKIVSTWEGIRAAEQLETEGIHCHLALVFSFAQAVACAEAGVTLISPFVGRIQNGHRVERGADRAADDDPGVASVTRIYNYFKKFDYTTQVMGASFRTVDQIVRLAGCDLLTIDPDLLEQMSQMPGPVKRSLSVDRAKTLIATKIRLDEKSFRWMHNEDGTAVEKLSEGIRKLYGDARRLEQYAQVKVAQQEIAGFRSEDPSTLASPKA
jgi:transaldolase